MKRMADRYFKKGEWEITFLDLPKENGRTKSPLEKEGVGAGNGIQGTTHDDENRKENFTATYWG